MTGASARKRLTGEARRQQIAEAALRIIAARGPGRLTAAELAREVGIADGTLFRHFRDMREIVSFAVGSLRSQLLQDFPPPPGAAPLERLEQFVLSRVRLAQARPDLHALAWGGRLAEATGELGTASLSEPMLQLRAFVEDCLREAQAEGSVDPDLPTRPLALLVMGCVHAAARGRPTEPWRRDEGPEAVWATLKSLLLRRPEARARPLGQGAAG